VEVLPHLDWDALRAAEPSWLIGYSDISTVHSQNLMDTPDRVPVPLLSWLDVITQPAGTTLSQGAATHHRATGFDRWEDDPTPTEFTLDTAGTWRLLDPGMGDVQVSGRLMGGCIETVSILAGTPYGDLPTFADLVNGALAHLTMSGSVKKLDQVLD